MDVWLVIRLFTVPVYENKTGLGATTETIRFAGFLKLKPLGLKDRKPVILERK